MIKVFIAEDVTMLREGMSMLISSADDLEFAGAASNGFEALNKIIEVKPDIVITDIQMPEMDGIELTKEIRSSYPKIQFIALTMFQDEHLIVDMLEAGARGYLMKSCGQGDVCDALRSVHAGGYYFCNNTSIKLSRLIAASKVDAFPKVDRSKFTDVEIEIIHLICEEFSSKEIASKLNLGLRTIEGYRHKIFEKMNTKNMAGVVIYAIKAGIYRP
jgi:DNA-binding NarL/FixJ family response regulator